jgi:hypothetical protein
LHLLEYPWRKHVLLDNHTMPATLSTDIHKLIARAGAIALVADLLLLKLELRLVPVVEILQGNVDPHFHVRAATLPTPVSEVSAAAEEAGEEVEGVVLLLPATPRMLL